ncbi:SpoIIE family protein phosphatase [Streptomyces sp. YIM 98790]|uniref:SpoIIE family protein phosphatase n=1 Tax=Streptomyces sp. YIM 98790 TaxID=2689077 RepID=UPI00140C477F|nr:SpoIIE family protein phosphatase [Streptomyces sp. YIM 98790]
MSDPWTSSPLKARAHDRFVHFGREPSEDEMRAAIRASWKRSKNLGVSQEQLIVPADTGLDPEPRLLRAARPALTELRDRLADEPVTILLTDAHARIVARRGCSAMLELQEEQNLVVGASCAERHLGTNSINMCLSTRSPFVVVGEEHYFHTFQALACIGSPIRDPLSGVVQGVVNLSMLRESAHPRMAVALERTASRIEHRLLELSTARERALAAEFLTLRGHGSGTLVPAAASGTGAPPAFSGRSLASLSALPLSAEDQDLLLERASEMIAAEDVTWAEVPLSHGGRAVLHRRVVRNAHAEGAAVEVSVRRGARHDGPAPPRTAPASGDSAASAASAASPLSPAPSAPAADADGAVHAAALPSAVLPPAVVGPRPSDGTAAGSRPGGVDRWLLMVGEPGVSSVAVAARRRLSLLNEASRRIGSTLDMEHTARELAEIAVPRLADLVVVDLLGRVAEGEEPYPGTAAPGSSLVRLASAARPGLPPVTAPPGDRAAPFRWPEHAAQTRALAQGRSVREPVLATASADDPADPAARLGPGGHLVLAVPLTARGVVLGVAGFYRSGGSEPFEADDLTLAEELAARTATCLDNARRYARERAASLTLQHSLLPCALPGLSAVQTAHRYFPADETTDVGGDWYDVIPLSGSRVALVVGDVVGHGLHAAATMGRLRTAVHTLADLDLPPEEVLAHLDELVSRSSADHAGREDPASGATCLYAVYDPVSRTCTAARAGHPPPAVAEPGGGPARLLDVPAGLPLGLGGLFPYAATETVLPEGSVLALYSDGLSTARAARGVQGAERRTDDDRLEVLFHALSRAARSPDASLELVCDKVTGMALTEGAADDLTLLLARTRALSADRVADWALPPDPAVVHDARDLVRQRLAGWGLAGLSGATELVVSELVTNAIRYGGGGPVGLRLIRDTSLICEVSDRSNSAPRIRRAGTSEEGGRGLFLVARFCRTWGTRYTPRGKTVWAEQPLDAAGPAPSAADDEETLLSLYADL